MLFDVASGCVPSRASCLLWQLKDTQAQLQAALALLNQAERPPARGHVDTRAGELESVLTAAEPSALEAVVTDSHHSVQTAEALAVGGSTSTSQKPGRQGPKGSGRASKALMTSGRVDQYSDTLKKFWFPVAFSRSVDEKTLVSAASSEELRPSCLHAGGPLHHTGVSEDSRLFEGLPLPHPSRKEGQPAFLFWPLLCPFPLCRFRWNASMCRGSSSAMPRGTLAVSVTNAHTELALCPWAQSWTGEWPAHITVSTSRISVYLGESPVMHTAASAVAAGQLFCASRRLEHPKAESCNSGVLTAGCFCCCCCRLGVLDLRRVREDAVDQVHVCEGALPPVHRA